jgi:rubrerythrin
MDIYEVAMQMEKDGESYYRQLARKDTVPELAQIFIMLADEERKHYNVIERMSKKEGNPQLVDARILEFVKNIFVSMQTAKADLHIDTTMTANEYRKACKIELMSQKFYLDKSNSAEDSHERQVFLQLAKEEDKHLRIMENIVEFVSRREPGNWLENAEWQHMDEY